MNITFFEWSTLDAWSVLVDNVVVGAVETPSMFEPVYRFYGKSALADFTSDEQIEILATVNARITLLNITKRLTS